MTASRDRRARSLVLAVALLFAAPWGAHAQSAASTDPVAQFDRFIAASGPLCLLVAAATCVEAAWAMADRDRDGLLSLGEAERVRDDLTEWARWKKSELHAQDWAAIQLGLLIVRLVGLDSLIAGLDADRDAGVSRRELLADVTLDDRPLPQVLSDRSAVDWDSIARRLGAYSGLLGGVAPTP
jgi:hypothetical protein